MQIFSLFQYLHFSSVSHGNGITINLRGTFNCLNHQNPQTMIWEWFRQISLIYLCFILISFSVQFLLNGNNLVMWIKLFRWQNFKTEIPYPINKCSFCFPLFPIVSVSWNEINFYSVKNIFYVSQWRLVYLLINV